MSQKSYLNGALDFFYFSFCHFEKFTFVNHKKYEPKLEYNHFVFSQETETFKDVKWIRFS